MNNNELVKEMLDLVANDSENLERTMKLLTDDCIWVIEPGGTEYHGSDQLRAFISVAMSGRTHDKSGPYKIEIINWFNNDENLCIEYTHGARLTGKYTFGLKKLKSGIVRYCITYHMHDGKIDRVHEYINSISWLYSCLMPIILNRLYKQAMKKIKYH